MKPYLLLLIVFIPFLLSAQYPAERRIRGFYWSKYEVQMPDYEKQVYFDKLVSSEKFSLPFNYTEEYNRKENQRFHFIDFDGDGRLDLIYEGRNPIGDESDDVAFFHNAGDSLRLLVELKGNMSKIYSYGKNRRISFQIVFSPCCDNYTYHVTDYVLNSASYPCKKGRSDCLGIKAECSYEINDGKRIVVDGDSSIIADMLPVGADDSLTKYDILPYPIETESTLASESEPQPQKPDPYEFFFWPVIAGVAFVVASVFILRRRWKRRYD